MIDIALLLDNDVDLISEKLQEIRELMGPLSTQMYAPVLFLDLDTVMNTVRGLTQEVENGVQLLVSKFNSQIISNFDVVFSRVDCQTDDRQFEDSVAVCISNMEATLDFLEETTMSTKEDISTNVAALMDTINECRGKASPILKAKCAVLNVKKVVIASETIRGDLERVSQSVSVNIQELSMNFEACIPECQSS